MSPTEFFKNAEIDISSLLGNYAVKTISAWKKIYIENGKQSLIKETIGKNSTGRPKVKDFVSIEAEVEYLRLENEFLKNSMPWRNREKKFSLISNAITSNPFLISKLFKLAGVSRTGYYKWKSRKPNPPTEDEKLIFNLFNKKKGKYGSRRLQMLIFRRYQKIMNLKKLWVLKKTSV